MTTRILLDNALAYAQLGLQVVPVYPCRDGVCTCWKGRSCRTPGKHPRARNGFKNATTDHKVIDKWWKRYPDANVGIATGAASNILVLDIDKRHGGLSSFDALVKELGPPPATPTAKTGGGGYHYFFSHPGDHVKSGTAIRDGIDVRADNAFVVAAPSIHASGRKYAWLPGKAPKDLPFACLPEAWLEFLKTGSCYRDVERLRGRDVEEGEAIQRAPPVSFQNPAPVPPDAARWPEVLSALAETVPRAGGTRNRRIFDFAQKLKGIPQLANCDPVALIPLVEIWHQEATTSGEHTLEDTIVEFVYAWGRVRFPGGFDCCAIAREVLKEAPHPAAALLRFTSPARVTLVGLCAKLQPSDHKSSFYLSSHHAAKVLTEVLGTNVNAMDCHRTLQTMVAARVLEETQKGDERKATRFHFTWPPRGPVEGLHESQ